MNTMDYFVDFEQTMASFRHRTTGAVHPKAVIDNALKNAALFYDADRAYIIETDWDRSISHNTFEWCREGVPTKIHEQECVSLQGYERWEAAHKGNQPIIIRSIEQFANMPFLYEQLKKNGVSSMLVVPLAKRVSGSLGVDNPRRYADKPQLLELMSYVVASEIEELKLYGATVLKTPEGKELGSDDVMINVLGNLEIHTTKGELSEDQISSRNSCKLIGLFLLNRRRRLAAGDISAMLWPNQLVDNPASSVKSAVYRARSIAEAICPKPLITAMHGLYQLNPDLHIYTDAGIFELLCKKARRECNAFRKISLYKTLLEYYRGDLVPAYAEEHWLMAASGHYHLLYLDAVKEYVSLLRRGDDYAEIQRVIFDALKVEHSDGDLHYWLIKTLLSQGADTAAHRLFGKAEQFLSVEQCLDLQSTIKIV